MKKLMFAVAAAAMFFAVGCSKESKYEGYQREMCEVSGTEKAEAEKTVAEAMEKFRKLSAEEQEKALKMAEEALKKAKEMKEKVGNMKSKLGL